MMFCVKYCDSAMVEVFLPVLVLGAEPVDQGAVGEDAFVDERRCLAQVEAAGALVAGFVSRGSHDRRADVHERRTHTGWQDRHRPQHVRLRDHVLDEGAGGIVLVQGLGTRPKAA
jgi:hypothetical protein